MGEVRHDHHRQIWLSLWIWHSGKCSHEALEQEQNVCRTKAEALPLPWMCFKSEIAVLMQWVSLTFSRRLGSSEWLLDRRLTAVSLNNWKRETHFGDLILVCQGKEAVCRYLMARLFSLTSLPVGETATSWYLTVSAVGSEILATLTFFSMPFSSPFSFSSALITKCRPGRSKASAFYRLFYHQSSRLCAGWQDGDVRRRGDFTARPPPALEKTPGKQWDLML